jgi:hypothetical protein
MNRKHRWLPFLGLVFTLSVACNVATPAWVEQTVIKRASFDLNCSKDQVKYQKLDGNNAAVIGCGQRAVYVLDTCDKRFLQSQCRIMLNLLNGQARPAPRQDR